MKKVGFYPTLLKKIGERPLIDHLKESGWLYRLVVKGR